MGIFQHAELIMIKIGLFILMIWLLVTDVCMVILTAVKIFISGAGLFRGCGMYMVWCLCKGNKWKYTTQLSLISTDLFVY